MESKPFRPGVPSLLPRTLEVCRGWSHVSVWCSFFAGYRLGPKPKVKSRQRVLARRMQRVVRLVPGPPPSAPVSQANPQASAVAVPTAASQSKNFAEAFRYGWDAAKKQRYNDAITEYTQALSFKPGDFDVYNDRGVVYLALRNITRR